MVYAMDFICEAESGNSSASIKPVVSLDPYETNQVDLSGNFRFSAQYLLSKEKLKRVEKNNCSQYEQGLGVNKVYSAEMEREFLFKCRSICR